MHLSDAIVCSKPFSFREFLELEKHAYCVLTDSGTVPEECAILSTPCILMRNSTERPELLENNSMILSGIKTEEILNAFEVVTNMSI
ncbi:UDP-N-acetylglucosamine 2-epimerase [Candidatus Peregrinibacteria bacterium]|nr:UDP-N-acetylglucosamine 2-epimerase [Candidatus Peregrinibacteria bacterium]